MRITTIVAVAGFGCVDRDLSSAEQKTELSWYGAQSSTVANGHTIFTGPYIDNANDGHRYSIAIQYPAISGFTKYCLAQGFVALTSADGTYPASALAATATSTANEWTYGVVGGYPAVATAITCDNELPADPDPCYGCWDY